MEAVGPTDMVVGGCGLCVPHCPDEQFYECGLSCLQKNAVVHIYNEFMMYVPCSNSQSDM